MVGLVYPPHRVSWWSLEGMADVSWCVLILTTNVSGRALESLARDALVEHWQAEVRARESERDLLAALEAEEAESEDALRKKSKKSKKKEKERRKKQEEAQRRREIEGEKEREREAK